MGKEMEIPRSSGKPPYNFNEVLKRVLAGESIQLYIRKQDKLYVFENLIDLIVEISFDKAKTFWKEIKQVFLENKRYKPFIFFDDTKAQLCYGKHEEDLSFYVHVDRDELYYRKHRVIVDPLQLQKLYDKYHKAPNLEAELEVDEYATYYISRELEKNYERKVKHII